MNLANFKGKGIVKEIGEVVEFDSGVKFITLEIEMELSKQILPFYITQTKDTPHAFELIRKYFGEFSPYKVGDNIQFDYNIIKRKDGKLKLKIWSLYNKCINS